MASRLWVNNPEMAKDFIDLCIDEIGTSGYQGTSLKQSSWKTIRDKLELKYPAVFTSDVGKKQKFVKNRWNALKRRYTAYRLCCSYTGNPLDVTTGLFTFTDEQWESLKKKNPDCPSFKLKPLEYKEEMEAMFDGVLVTFENSASHGMMNRNYVEVRDGVEEEDDDEVNEVEGFTQDTYFQGVSFASTQNIEEDPVTPMSRNTQNIPSSSGTSKSSKRKRVEPTPTNGPGIPELVSMVQVYYGAKMAASSIDGGGYSLATCMMGIEALEEDVHIEREVLNAAIRELGKSAELRKSFMSLTSNAQRARLIESLGM